MLNQLDSKKRRRFLISVALKEEVRIQGFETDDQRFAAALHPEALLAESIRLRMAPSA